MLLRFTKMHGLGNDFMVLDLISQNIHLRDEQIRELADRRTGIGFDQLLLVEPPQDPDVDFRYRIFNTDGSEAEQCGNGARCFMRFVRDRGLTAKTEITIETNTGLIQCKLEKDGNITINMGPPALSPEQIPFIADHSMIQYELEVVSSLPTHIHRSRPGIDILGLPQEVFDKVYGRHIPTDYTSYEGRSYMIWWHEMLYAVGDSLGLCRFQTVFNSPNCPQYPEYSRLIKLALGWDISIDELKRMGERIYTTERLLLGKFNVGSRTDDYPPESWFTGGREWARLDKGKYETFLNEYYDLHGWDTYGVPTKDSIKELAITEAKIN
jgi:hypothetical protein